MTRTSADIGAGLASSREAQPIPVGQRIHVVGAAGAGASAAALLAASAGALVTACDPGAPTPYTAALDARGITVTPRHDVAHVADGSVALVDRLAVSKALTAVDPDQPELVAARTLGVPLESWQQLVADAAATAGQELVGVAGTHGKSTATGWLLHILVRDGRDPSGFVGALMAPGSAGDTPSTARVGAGALCVVEADEYAGNFEPYRASMAILLNAEWDHPDVFADREEVLDAFEAWIRAMVPDASGRPPRLVVNVGDLGAAAVAMRLGADWPGVLVRVALEGDDPPSASAPSAVPSALPHELRGRIVTGDQGYDVLELRGPSLPGGPGAPRAIRVPLPLPGRHNAANALCVAAAGFVLGLDARAVSGGIGSFAGVGRRLEVKGEPGGVLVLDDYAHHPTAISATLDAVRAKYPGRPVWAVYEPLTYHRTAAMLDGFADALAAADHAAVADIWAGRDPDLTVVSAADLAAAITTRSARPALATGSPEASADRLAELVRPGDVVLVMGGGRSYVIAERLVATLADRQAE